MNANPRTSVIIPVLNEQDRIGNAIRSAGDAGADEIIVVDGGSQDHSVEVAREFPCRVMQCAAGRGRQLDTGARIAVGEILVFLHADCKLTTRCLDQIRQAVLNQDARWGCFRQRIDARQRRFRWLEQGNAWRAGIRQLVYGDQCLWVRKHEYETAGGFPHLSLMEDVVMSDRLRDAGRPLVLPGPLVISSRGWKSRGIVRQTIRNWILFGLFRWGVSAERLASWYR